MLREGAIQQVKSEPGEFLSNLFLVNKKDEGHRPIINLKFLNSFIPYQHFKMEGMHLIKDLLQEHDFLIKIDLKDAPLIFTKLLKIRIALLRRVNVRIIIFLEDILVMAQTLK